MPRADAYNTRCEHDFQAQGSVKHRERLAEAAGNEGAHRISFHDLFLGIAASKSDQGEIEIGLCAHDGTYSIDFAVRVLTAKHSQKGDVDGSLADYFVSHIREYQEEHGYKFIGVGITQRIVHLSPTLPARLWADLDIVPLVLHITDEDKQGVRGPLSVDEEADSMARKCLMFFGPGNGPRIQVGRRNQVEVDAGSRAQLTYLDEYRSTVGERTWEATMRYAKSLKERNISIAFFSATPQGGGVALMRHALIRFLRQLDIDVRWFVPRPKPEVFRITKTNHNILQGVADPSQRLSEEQAHTLDQWVEGNANYFWLRDGGCLASRSKGGADVIIIDDPQMPGLIPLSKKADPGRPVVFRSHIQIRSDLVDQSGSPTAQVWQWLYHSVKAADLFISHPVKAFVPNTVDFTTVGYMPATTDWLDGLNKNISAWNTQYYIQEFNNNCREQRMAELAWPTREYIIQVARFDPAKGIPDVIASYAELRRKYLHDKPPEETPRLVVTGHSSVDDPDGTMIYDEALDLLEKEYPDIAESVIVMRLGPKDQLLNAILSSAKIALQLSTREGFEVKVSEALHKGIPVIATKTGGIPLQVEHDKSGFLVDPGDSGAVAKYMYQLLTDKERYERMSKYAASHVSDEVSTVGNALCWSYMASTLSKGEKICPNGAWINDMARREANMEYVEGEVRLPRSETT
ncbi:hypothetical protein B0A49_11684 [Cryomyces minteri]|uniref:Uncharacterized protein n=1 Tax=Cryomyces minteri TaxID=331657 RepID=A0A4U0WHH9_9PEZI|nr:hypothetical protein B0A49_11684 [Cryomyces minteri]